MNNIKNSGIILLITLSFLYFLFFIKPMPQDLSYHQFADQINHFAINHFHNVISNLCFIIIGLYGLKITLDNKEISLSWYLFIISIILVGPGSAYYHFNPNNETLFWDRLPMTLGFISLSSYVLIEIFKIKKEFLFISITFLIGMICLMYWVKFDDLRFYLWVQLTPIVLLLYIALFYQTERLKKKYLFCAVVLYVLAKMTEKYDATIFEKLHYSGHSLKHLLAGLGVYSLILMYKKRSSKSL